jgi:hypothetical protein
MLRMLEYMLFGELEKSTNTCTPMNDRKKMVPYNETRTL